MATGTVVLGNQTIYDADVAPLAAIDRTKMAQRTNARFPINLTTLRVWDAMATNLPGTPATDDLGLVLGAFGSLPTYVGTGDVKAAGCTRYARFLLSVPHDFEINQTLTLRAFAGMKTTIADGTATLDVEVWRNDADGTVGAADLYVGSALTINSVTASTKDYLIDPTGIAGGDILDVRLTITITDAATATAVIGAVWQLELLVDLR